MMLFLATAAVLLSAAAPSPGKLQERIESSPRKVAAFIERRALCDHFLGEEPYDKERAAYLDRTVRELRCDRIDRDEGKLRRAYRNDPAILQLLDQSADTIGW